VLTLTADAGLDIPERSVDPDREPRSWNIPWWSASKNKQI
jgi:hypothetical protein